MFCCTNKSEKQKKSTSVKINLQLTENSINEEFDTLKIVTPPQVPKRLIHNLEGYDKQEKLLGQKTKSDSKLKEAKLTLPSKLNHHKLRNPFKKYDTYKLITINRETQFLAVKEQFTLVLNRLQQQ